MQLDPNDIMRIGVPRDEHFAMGSHHPVVVGRPFDRRQAYIFDLDTDDGRQYFVTGPAPEESFRRISDGSLTGPSQSDKIYAWVF